MDDLKEVRSLKIQIKEMEKGGLEENETKEAETESNKRQRAIDLSESLEGKATVKKKVSISFNCVYLERNEYAELTFGTDATVEIESSLKAFLESTITSPASQLEYSHSFYLCRHYSSRRTQTETRLPRESYRLLILDSPTHSRSRTKANTRFSS